MKVNGDERQNFFFQNMTKTFFFLLNESFKKLIQFFSNFLPQFRHKNTNRDEFLLLHWVKLHFLLSSSSSRWCRQIVRAIFQFRLRDNRNKRCCHRCFAFVNTREQKTYLSDKVLKKYYNPRFSSHSFLSLTFFNSCFFLVCHILLCKIIWIIFSFYRYSFCALCCLVGVHI